VTWLPGYQRVVIPGALGQTHLARVTKVCWHTTEGGSVEGAVAAYTARRVPPHVTVDPARGRLVQHVPLDKAAYALHAVDQTGVIQIEVVGWAREARSWSPERLRWLGEQVLAPIFAACPGIDRHLTMATRDEQTNTSPPLASPNSPIRLARSAWDRFSGCLGHQHAPPPNHHWDPGALDLAAISAAARAVLTPAPPPPPPAPDSEDTGMELVYIQARDHWFLSAPGGVFRIGDWGKVAFWRDVNQLPVVMMDPASFDVACGPAVRPGVL
jgi:hypothetical protein